MYVFTLQVKPRCYKTIRPFHRGFCSAVTIYWTHYNCYVNPPPILFSNCSYVPEKFILHFTYPCDLFLSPLIGIILTLLHTKFVTNNRLELMLS